MAVVKWTPEKMYAEVQQKMRGRMVLATMYLKNKTRHNISEPTRTQGPSKPGEFLHRDTGHLHRSIFSSTKTEGKEIVGIVGTTSNYGKIHELTKRPFLRRTLLEEQGALKRILGGGGGAAMTTT